MVDTSGRDKSFLDARIQDLTSNILAIDAVLQRNEFAHENYKLSALSDAKGQLDKRAYRQHMSHLHKKMILASRMLSSRVRQCHIKKMSSDEMASAVWPNVLLPGASAPATVTLGDCGRAVDDAFFSLMNFLVEMEPVDEMKGITKHKKLLNDRLAYLIELRKCQLKLLDLDDPAANLPLSDWTMMAMSDAYDEHSSVCHDFTNIIP